MKNLIAGVLVLCVIIGMMLMCDYIENHYTLDVVVTDVDSDVVTVETQTGKQYQYNGNGVEKGEHITVVMYTNHTDSRADDQLIDVR